MSVPEQIPYVGYVANGQTTEFPITFDLHDPEYLIVTVNKEIPVVGTYTVDMNALKVVFATAPTDGTQVELYRETELNRDTNYQKYDNSFRPEAVNYDFDKIWHVLQEQDMIDAELLARLKAEIEWRRTHDANFDELAKMRDAQIFSGLKQYIDTYIAATNPNIFEGITAGIVFALDKKSVQTHLENIYQELIKSNQSIAEEKSRAEGAEQELEGLISTQQANLEAEIQRAIISEAAIDAKVNANGVGNRAYKTYADMDADKANIPAKSKVTVTNDATPSNNGDWQWDGTTFTKSIYDPISQANDYTDQKTKKLDDVLEQEYPFSVSDGSGRTAFAILEDGTAKAAEVDTDVLSVAGSKIEEDDLPFSIADKNGKYALALKPDGTTVAASIETNELKVDGKDINSIVGQVRKIGYFAYNIVHFEIFGQSLSQGAYSSPIQTTTQKFDNIMFVGGIRPQHPSYNVPNFFESFIPLVEAKDISGYVGYETPCGGATDCVKQLISDENGIEYTQQKYQLLGSACGEGGMSLASLSTTYLNNNLKPAITNAFNLAQAQGLTYGMPLMGWVQGEEDNKPGVGTTIQQYKDGLQNLIGLVDAHLKTLNSDLALDGLITTQLCSFKTSGRTEPHIELAIYQAATEASSNVYLACPLYIFDYADGYHINGVSSNWMGAYIGLVHKRVLVDGEDWKPVHPISSVRQGKIAEIRFHVPVQPLVFDTTHVALNTNYGFTLVDSANNPLSISSVAITQGDTVKIVAVDPIPAGAKLRYAWTPSAQPNRSTGPRGNLRDSQGNDLVFDPEGINKPLHNWCPIFEYVIN